jgi:thiamine-phosphate diphosphorylase
VSDLSILPQSLNAALADCVQALAKGCPKLVDDVALLERLGELRANLQPTVSLPTELGSPSVTLTQALAMTSAAQGLLTALREAGNDAVSSEALLGLSQALSVLSAKLGVTWRREQARRVRGLYVIIDPEVTAGRDPLDIAKAAIKGGAKMLQLRDKLRDKGESLPLATGLQELCEASDVLLIVNDHIDLAVAVGSGGVHVGQTDMPVSQARQVLDPHQVLGRSNRELEQLAESQEMGADHVAFGPIYQTGTKSIVRQPQGVERLRQARDVAKVPLVAIGGINVENVAPVVDAGADAICVTAAVGAAPDPEAAASRLVSAIRQAGGKV